MKIGKKLALAIISVVVVGVSILISVVLNTAHKEINGLINNELHNLAEQEAEIVRSWLDDYLTIAQTLSDTMTEGLSSLEKERRRSVFNMMLRGVLVNNDDIDAVGTCWEPDALDGMDALYANTPGTDATGRFISYWAQEGDKVSLTPFLNYDVPGKGDYYLAAKRSGKETVMDPYTYQNGGKEKLVTSVTAPVIINGEMKGAVIIDIGINDIQEKILEISPYEGSIAAVFSNGGLVSGHFESSHIGKPMRESEKELAGPYLEELIRAVKEGKSISFTNYVPGYKENMFFITVPFIMGKTTTPWSLLIGIPNKVITAPVVRMLKICAPIVTGMLALIVVAVIFLARSIAKPLTAMMTTFNEVGEGDFTRSLDIKRKD
ncbi:MAG: hypothetical protein LBG76_06485, partial [Treponema sp.]|nr:hypothetical protein [Treponema sp.]